ncbi:LysM peptidoglycan-binding domain-containing protein [Herbiconiux daphne]|uniref:LysM peptidoglycan-binding domain-containing protein n=1 Tax=Herbiconiux daphne TaxID=2970914 RepID=A0ABT2GWM7_9MICO|nr:LysM domain-containing protein [Herbiconiux daphne]MCS5732352.1 LysM peptidoglycan-binding domain-containing protein [Herbiconiux daphne]
MVGDGDSIRARAAVVRAGAVRAGAVRAGVARAGAVLAGVVLLGGCAGTTGEHPVAASGTSSFGTTSSATGSTDAAAAATPAAPSGSAEWVFEPLPADTVLGRGTIQSPDQAVTGTIEIVTTHDRMLEAVFTGFTTSDSRPLQTTFVSAGSSTLGCYNPEGFAFALPQLSASEEQRFPMGPVDEFPSADPGFLDRAEVYAPAEGAGPEGFEGCYGDVIGIADLTWTIAQTVAPAVDTGAVAGASGSVTVDDAGRPLRYEVAAGDTLTAIAARFGVAPAQLLYLSAGRLNQGVVDDENVYAGESLVLDPSLR